jgi:hypothetical protein
METNHVPSFLLCLSYWIYLVANVLLHLNVR